MVYLLLGFMLLQGTSCKLLFPNYLFRENKDYYYLELKELEGELNKLRPSDRISFQLFSRDGYQLIDVSEGRQQSGGFNAQRANQAGYIVKPDGYVEFPLIGNIYVEGMDRIELEDMLEEKYAPLYNSPYVIAQVTNRRVLVFTGLGGASVVSLTEERMRLIEVIALAGGIPRGAKSHKIKIIRGDLENPTIKKVDLSTIAGLKDADLVVQSGDLIIIDPTTPLAPAILKELTPVLSLITTLLTFYLLIRRNR